MEGDLSGLDVEFRTVVASLIRSRQLSAASRSLTERLERPVSRQALVLWADQPSAHALEKQLLLSVAQELAASGTRQDSGAILQKIRGVWPDASDEARLLVEEAVSAAERLGHGPREPMRLAVRSLLVANAMVAIGDIEDVSSATVTMTHIDGIAIWSRLLETAPAGALVRVVSADDPLSYWRAGHVDAYLLSNRKLVHDKACRFERLVVSSPNYSSSDTTALRGVLLRQRALGIHVHMISDGLTAMAGNEFAVVANSLAFEHAPDVGGRSRTIVNFSRTRVAELTSMFDQWFQRDSMEDPNGGCLGVPSDGACPYGPSG